MNLLPRGDDRFHSQSMDGSGQRLYVGSETTLAEVQAQLQMRHRDACVGFMGVRQEQAARKHHEAWCNGSVQCHLWAGAAPRWPSEDLPGHTGVSASASVDGASAQGQLACQHQRFPVHLDHGDFRSLRLYDARRHVRAQQTTSAFASRTSRNSNDQLFHGSLPSGSTTRTPKNPSLNSSMPSFAAINNQMRSRRSKCSFTRAWTGRSACTREEMGQSHVATG